ncbi:hypothetical protein ACGF3G_30550 [Streptomyces sp. NPDC048179]|uniref:hypothetical protein n=1 Tax=Streptomyces sp. NPDC048179 TaxID=3365506 RepID=UPI003716CA32
MRGDDELKSVVVDGSGKTVYVFADAATSGKGVDQDLMGSITRVDGSKQLTLAGKPLYTYAKDEPGDTKAGAGRPVLGVLDSPKLGRVLQDKNGRTLYLFTKDTPWPMTTACDAKCLQKWTPSAPVTAADAEAAGLSPEILFTFTTPGGTKQESFNCWPAGIPKSDRARQSLRPDGTKTDSWHGQGLGPWSPVFWTRNSRQPLPPVREVATPRKAGLRHDLGRRPR